MSELGRRAVHLSGTAVPVAYLEGVLSWPQVEWLLLVAAVTALALEAVRLTRGIDFWAYRRLTRDYEHQRVAGYALAILGAAVTAWLFAPFVAAPAMLMLTIADPLSGVLSRGKLGVKQGYVLLATFGVCLGIASVLRVPFWPAVAGAGAATVADGVKPTLGGRVLDDNLTIPIAAGAAMALVLSLL